jgi:hypothetical protein
MADRQARPWTALTMAERDEHIVELKGQGLSFQQVADQVGISKSGAILGFQRVKRRVNERADDNYATYRDDQLARIAVLREVVADIVHTRHVTISNGHVISEITGRDDDGKPIYGDPYEDDAPTLAAIDRMVKLDEREAKLLGLDAEQKLNLSGGITYEIVGVNQDEL